MINKKKENMQQSFARMYLHKCVQSSLLGMCSDSHHLRRHRCHHGGMGSDDKDPALRRIKEMNMML